MVSVSRVMSIQTAKAPTKAALNTIKKTAPITGGLAVLAGAGMSGVDELSYINAAPLPQGANVFEDPILDQVAYRASQVGDVGANLAEGVAEMAHGAGHIATTIVGAAVDGVDFAADCAAAAIWKPIVYLLDTFG